MTSSTYLQAIQNVAGSTPGEKYKTLNHVARRIIAASNGQGDTIQVRSSPELPEMLIPFVKLEIARIMRQPDGIVEALKSDDNLVFNRALRVKWFFDGSIETVTNADYFRDRILSWISVKNRLQLIKTLSAHLTVNNKYCIAEKFYSTLSEMYGRQQSEPLLSACSELFIWDAIIRFQLVLSVRTVERLYLKHPDIIIKYLKLGKPNDEPYGRNMHRIPLENYDNFYPRLLKNHTDIFIDIIITHYPSLKLSRKSTEIFLKKRIDVVISNASAFLEVLNLKSISSKLTEEQFEQFIHNLYSSDTLDRYTYFPFMKMHDEYLQYYPSEKKVPLILRTFKQVYKKNFIDCDELLNPEVMCLLSPEDRVYAARKKLEKNPEWPTRYGETKSSWRCYLPLSESIPIIKEQISKTSNAEQRKELLRQLIYSCKVNDDLNILLKVLEYIATRHKNERGDILLGIIAELMNQFKVQNLSHKHWKPLDDIIQTLKMKDELTSIQYIAINLFGAKIHFNLIHGLSITEPIKFLCDLKKHSYPCTWNILQEHPEYERRCLEEFIKVAPPLYSKEKSMMDLVNNCLCSINDFNERNSKAENKIQPMIIQNDWFLTQIQELVNSDKGEYLRLNLKKCDPVLYNTLVKNKRKDKIGINLRSNLEFSRWKKNPDKIAEHWEKYLQECMSGIHRKYGQRYIKICRWYQSLPIKFTEACMKAIIVDQDSRALIALAVLYEGSEFERFINQFLPTNLTIDSKAEDAKQNYSIVQSITEALLIVNPPVSLDVTSKLCNSDSIRLAANWLKDFSRRTSVDKFIPFATKFMDKPVSISKYFVRTFSTAATIKECHSVYMNIWRNEKHRTIRTLVFGKIFNLFVSNPNDETWRMLTECIDNLTVDDEDAMNSVCRLDKIPNEYIPNYVRKLFITLRKLENISDNVDPKFIWSHIVDLLQLSDYIAALFPEELHHEILKTYFTDFSLPPNVTSAAQYYLINAYINPALDKLESRLKFYSNMLIDILKNQWDIPDPRRPNVYPANHMVDSAIIGVLCFIRNHETRLKFVDATFMTVFSVLNPLQAPMIYSYLVFVSLHRQSNISKKDYANNIREVLPSLITTFSVGFIGILGQILEECLELLWTDFNSRHEVTADIIQSLLELNNEQTTMLAIAIISRGDKMKDDEHYSNILQTLRQQKNPAAIASAAIQINRRSLEDAS